MYFKIVNVGEKKYEDMGMVNIDAAFYLEKGDEGYDDYLKEHLVAIPILPPEGYTKTKESVEYRKWLESLPTEQVLNPFCNHSMQFEADATEEEILYCFEWALAITHRNYLKKDLHCKTNGQVVNQSINYIERKTFYSEIENIAKKTPEMKLAEKLKEDAAIKAVELRAVDFSKIKTTGEYRVK